MLNQFIIIISLKYQHYLGISALPLPDASYNIPAIQNYIEYIIKKHETIGETAPIIIYANTINSTKDTIDADKNSENVPRLENVELV